MGTPHLIMSVPHLALVPIPAVRWIGVILLAVFLAACAQEADLTVYTSRKWKVETQFTYSPSMLPNFSGDISEIGMNVDIPTGGLTDKTLQYTLDQLVAMYEAEGIQAKWRRSARGDEVTYLLTLQGQGLDQLRELALGGEGLAHSLGGISSTSSLPTSQITLTELGNDQIRLVMGTPSTASPSPMMGLFKSVFRLHAGKIVSANTKQIQGGTATWQNPVYIEAVFTQVPEGLSLDGPVLWILLAAGGLALVISAGSFLLPRLLTPSPWRGYRAPVRRPPPARRPPGRRW